MKKKLTYLFYFISLAFWTSSFAQKIKVRLLTSLPTSKAIFSPLAGDYRIVMDTIILNSENSADVFELSMDGDSIDVKSFEKGIGKCKKIVFEALVKEGSFKLKSVTPETKVKTYDDDLEVTVMPTGLKLINKVDMEDYIAGVVESEAGTRSSLEYYKLQSILCRTYALSNLRKHEPDSFNLCDLVHCQAYKGKTENPNVLKAVSDTKGLVIVDDDLNLISAAFHSNCGGQTLNSEDVWSLSATYLRSVKDTFCLKMPNARWQKKILKTDWINYLSLKQKYPIEDSVSYNKAISFPQTQGREIYFANKELKIPLKNIRSDWQLKSTYFSIQQRNDTILFNGRGYGHGVGLCQEGAMRRAQLGISYKDILGYYYTKVHLVDQAVLRFFRED